MLKRYSWRVNCYMIAEVCADPDKPEHAQLLAAINTHCLNVYMNSSAPDQAGELQTRVSGAAIDVQPVSRR